ncbi:MAG TPA: FHA domain-containing protein [Polyangia bacterium]|nr:FHA domain-containing protein [Polyangia bacterium]
MTEKGGEPKALSFDKDEVTIGRVSGNDIVLPKGNVSKRHSRLLLKEGHVEISDLKSTNGTYVNGKKITETTPVGSADRVYVGDFLITIDGLGGELASHSRRMPPPPPPPRAGSSSAALPTVDASSADATSASEDDGGADEDELPLAAKPPRAGRVPPPPPPPPPKRPPTPIATPALGGEDDALLGEDLAPPSPAEMKDADDSTNNVGLFERRKTADHATFEGGGGEAPSTGSRPGAALPPEPAPLPAPPGQPAAPAPDFAAAAATGDGEGLEALLGDPTVLQIIVAGPDATYVDRGDGPVPYAPGLGDANTVADTLWRIANTAVPPPSPDNPVVDVRLSDGTRLAAVFPPVSPVGVVGSIRRPAQTERALVDLLPPGAKDLQSLLEAAVMGQRNLLLTGDLSAVGALAGALAALIPSGKRVVAIGGGVVRARPGVTELQPTGDLGALVRVAASLRAEHLVVADAAGPEVLDLLLAAARGQEGLMIVAPSRAVAEGLARVEALAAPTFGTAPAGPLVCSTIDLVVHVVANAEGGARVVDVAEPKMDGGRVIADAVITWRADNGRRGGAGKLQVTGVSARLGAALAAAGQSLPSSLVRR